MEWTRQGKDGAVAQEIAAYAGQNPELVRNIVMAMDTHVIITWTNRPRVWEYWVRLPADRVEDGTWFKKVATCTSAAEAKHQAEQRQAETVVLEEVRALPEGTALTVVAEWREPYHGSKPLVLPCSSSDTAEVIAGIFKRMGCSVTTQVAA